MNAKKQILIASLLILMAAIPVTLLLTQEEQDTRSRASASSSLSYTPNTTSTTPLEKNVGDPIALDIIVNPGNNLPSLIKLEMLYDATKFDPAQTPFTVNTTAFPSTIEGPIVLEGKVLVSVSIGNDVTKAIQQPTKVGTLNLIAKAGTNGTASLLAFGDQSQILSLAENDEATENVLATTQPSFITIAAPTVIATGTATPTISITTEPTLQPTLSPTPTVSLISTLTPTVNPTTTTLSFTVFMHGIGNSGDNANPTANDMSNKQPLHPTREIMVALYDDQNQLTATKTGVITYDTANGSFKGLIDIGDVIQSGVYTIRVKEGTHLRRLVPGIQQLTPLTVNSLPVFDIIAGDANNDNKINILDYNLLVGCYSDLLPAISCTDENKVKTDLNDNGQVNQFDYNLFLREITVQAGN